MVCTESTHSDFSLTLDVVQDLLKQHPVELNGLELAPFSTEGANIGKRPGIPH